MIPYQPKKKIDSTKSLDNDFEIIASLKYSTKY